VFGLEGTTLVVSRGIGTTFVPFRFCSRPQAAVLVLRAAR
jgi:predicted MPP superfamily phosphohydrolase